MNNHLDKISDIISNRTISMLNENILFKELRNRPPLKLELEQYLINTHFLITHTQKHLQAALSCSVKVYDRNVAEYFFEKIFEEIGHEKWAEDDCKSNQINTNIRSEKPVPSMLNLSQYLDEISRSSPIQYAVYTYVSEFMISKFGYEVLVLFQATPNNSNTVTVLAKHVELDVEHADGDQRRLEIMLKSLEPEILESIFRTVEKSLNLIDQSFKEIYEQAQFRARESFPHPFAS